MKCFVCKETFHEPKITQFGKDQSFAIAWCPRCTAVLPRDLPDDVAAKIVREVAELPDRTSPADAPDMMLVTADELRAIVLAALQPAE